MPRPLFVTPKGEMWGQSRKAVSTAGRLGGASETSLTPNHETTNDGEHGPLLSWTTEGARLADHPALDSEGSGGMTLPPASCRQGGGCVSCRADRGLGTDTLGVTH